MPQQQKYQLIFGEFKSCEALPIIMSFYNNKINYHNIQLLTAMERNEGNISQIEQKVKELQNTSDEIRELLTNAVDRDHPVHVKGFIEISI